MGEGKDRQRSSIMVFPEDAEAFVDAVQEMAKEL